EAVTGTTLDVAAQRYVFHPIGMTETSFINSTKVQGRTIAPDTTRIAPTERCPWRKTEICGEVWDENTWAMGGVSGFAGIFSIASDLHRLATVLLGSLYGEYDFLSSSLLQQAWRV